MQAIRFSKKAVAAFVFIIVFTSLAGCGKKEIKNIDVKELGNSLLSDINYEDELTEIDKDTAQTIYNFQDINIIDSIFYIGSGATAEEIVVLECENSDQTKEAKKVLETRVEEQKKSFQDYVPEELKKLNKAVITAKGTYVILSVSNDDTKAKQIIEKAFE